MALKQYQKKRDFTRTPEPKGKERKASTDGLRFVVQKHEARRLHYDFRLELDGVLKSWALPKGPTLNPADKKLAVMVEDHPMDYRSFEGVIPEDNYGAGTVMVWDEGTYHVPGLSDRAQMEEELRHALETGDVKFVLEGEKLKGAFALVKIKKSEDNSWLLIKKRDDYATEEDVLEKDYSVRSGRTLEKIESEEDDPEPQAQRIKIDVSKLDLRGARKSRMFTDVKPMLARLAEETFDHPDWLFEIKWDGFRAIAELHKDLVKLYSRKLLDFEKKYPPVFADLKKLEVEAILDGEIVVVDKQGRARFNLLQNYPKSSGGNLVYYVFDLLYLAGHDLRSLPLIRRKQLLKQILPPLPHIKISDHIESQGKALFERALENDIEGIMAKNKNSLYQTDARSADWLKIKREQRQEAVIGGFTQGRGSRTGFGALLLGVYEGDDLVYVGHTGGGFDEATLTAMRTKLDTLVRRTSPFKQTPKANAPATWTKPELVCEVRFFEWTQDGIMREPIFLGLREDKDPRSVKRERPVPAAEPVKGRYYRPPEEKTIVEIDGQEVQLTNMSKVFWPEEGITKGDVIAYYRKIAPYILPYLIDRPESLHRQPHGIRDHGFFHKDIDHAPQWVKTHPVPSDAEGEELESVLCQNEATLAYLANLGCIEIHPWNSRVTRLDYPDYMIIDLDPLECSFDVVIEVALAVHELLEKIEVKHCVKTSGATGMHIYVPLGAQYDYEQTRQFGNLISALANNLAPKLTSVERVPAKRKGRVYLDVLQNRRGQTLAAPYSLRPRPKVPVSTPLQWEELRPGLRPEDFNINNIHSRLAQVGDIWKGVLGPGIDMGKSVELMKKTWKK